MKKMKFLSLLIAFLLTAQCALLPVQAAEPLDPLGTVETVPEETEPEFGTVCIHKGCRTIEGMSPLAGSDKRLDTAQAAFLYEMNTGTVVYSYNPDLKVAPGSLAKLVNAAVVMERTSLDTKVTLTRDINRRPAGSIHSGLKADEELTVRDLLHCMLLESGNDAAIGLAVHVAGDQSTFTTLMNQWVESIGCVDTRFGNAHGVGSTESVTTAREMAKIMMAAIENEELREILGTQYYKLPATNKNTERSFRTVNYMADKGILQDFYDDRVTGGLASYVDAYGASLVVTAKSKHADEAKQLNYVGVVLGCIRTFDTEDTWRPVIYGNFNEMTELLKMGFNSYKVNRIVYDGMAMSQFTVAGGECDAVGEARVNIDSVVPASAQMDNLIMNYKVVDGLRAPIKKDDLIATVQVEYRGSVMAEAEVYAMADVKPADNNGITIHSLHDPNGSRSGLLSVIGTICVTVLGLAVAYLAFNSYMRSRIRARRRKRRAERRRNY